MARGVPGTKRAAAPAGRGRGGRRPSTGGAAEEPAIPANATPQKRQLTISSRVTNRLNQTFNDMTVEEKEVRLAGVPAMTLRKRLHTDLEAAEKGTFQGTFGGDYNDRLRKMYKSQTVAEKKLECSRADILAVAQANAKGLGKGAVAATGSSLGSQGQEVDR